MVTKHLPCSPHRTLAEAHVNVAALAVATCHRLVLSRTFFSLDSSKHVDCRVAAMAQAGQAVEARRALHAVQRLMQRAASTDQQQVEWAFVCHGTCDSPACRTGGALHIRDGDCTAGQYPVCTHHDLAGHGCQGNSGFTAILPPSHQTCISCCTRCRMHH